MQSNFRINHKLFPVSVVSSVLLIPSDPSVTWSRHGASWWSSQLFSLHVTKSNHGSLTGFSAVTGDIKYFLKLKAGEMAGTTNWPHYKRMTNERKTLNHWPLQWRAPLAPLCYRGPFVSKEGSLLRRHTCSMWHSVFERFKEYENWFRNNVRHKRVIYLYLFSCFLVLLTSCSTTTIKKPQKAISNSVPTSTARINGEELWRWCGRSPRYCSGFFFHFSSVCSSSSVF